MFLTTRTAHPARTWEDLQAATNREHGVLTVALPKVERARPRQITVQVQKA